MCEIVPATPTKFTVADLARLLRSAPRPDDEYLDIVDDLLKRQPKVGPSLWER